MHILYGYYGIFEEFCKFCYFSFHGLIFMLVHKMRLSKTNGEKKTICIRITNT